MTPRPRRREAGFSILTLMAGVAIMLILMAAAVPSWKYVMKNAREEELIFRALQINDAIQRFQQDPRNGGTFPVSLEVLVQGKYLRKAYKDPMVEDGRWGIIRQGDALAIQGAPVPGVPQPSPSPTTETSRSRRRPSPSPSSGFGQTGTHQGGGPITGVYSLSEEESLRTVNGQNYYNKWKFVVGQPVTVGKRLVRGAVQPGRQGQTQ